jgi:hypothetical protein
MILKLSMISVACLLSLSIAAAAQGAIRIPAQKTIGASKLQLEPSLIVMNAQAAALASLTVLQ